MDTKSKTTEEWGKTERSVTLTNAQWNKLTCYLLMTTQHRQNEQKFWAELAKEKKADGTPAFEHAASNAEYYRELEIELAKIRIAIDTI